MAPLDTLTALEQNFTMLYCVQNIDDTGILVYPKLCTLYSECWAALGCILKSWLFSSCKLQNLTCWAVIGAVRQWMGCVTVSECSVGDCFGVGHFIQCWAVYAEYGTVLGSVDSV